MAATQGAHHVIHLILPTRHLPKAGLVNLMGDTTGIELCSSELHASVLSTALQTQPSLFEKTTTTQKYYSTLLGNLCGVGCIASCFHAKMIKTLFPESC